jgi:hypothetical protein
VGALALIQAANQQQFEPINGWGVAGGNAVNAANFHTPPNDLLEFANLWLEICIGYMRAVTSSNSLIHNIGVRYTQDVYNLDGFLARTPFTNPRDHSDNLSRFNGYIRNLAGSFGIAPELVTNALATLLVHKLISMRLGARGYSEGKALLEMMGARQISLPNNNNHLGQGREPYNRRY